MATSPKTAATYSRFSTDKQDARSIDDQQRRCRAWAVAHGLTVSREFADAAVSGTHTEREDLQRLLAEAARKQFRHVLVDDLSRLSRDLGDMWGLVFGTLAGLDVVVIDCMTGMASDSPGARMTFGAMGLVSDGFIQMIRQETHRGLEGRALGGFWTGGRVYGYGTRPEENPKPDAGVRAVPIILADEAAVVLRIFQDFADGRSLQFVADALNREQIPAPHDKEDGKKKKGNKGVHGWGHPTVRAMLLNSRYRGRLLWNQSKWVKVPGKKGRRRIMRPESEWIVREVPELQIVPPKLWDAVQARFTRRRPGARTKDNRGTHVGEARRHPTLFSGLMKCGECTSAYVVVGRGKGYAQYGCAGSRSRGDVICSNRKTISEFKLRALVVAEVRRLADTPELLKFFVDEFQRAVVALQKKDNVRDLEAQLADAERRVKRGADALLQTDNSPAVAAAIREQEARATMLRSKIQEARQHIVVPLPPTVASYLKRVWTALTAEDTAEARKLLQLVMRPLVLKREGDALRVTGGFDLEVPGGPPVIARSSSGGLIHDLAMTLPVTFSALAA